MPPALSIISHYYNQPDRVREQIAAWEALPESLLCRVEFVLVDDGSREMVEFAPTKLDLHVFRIATDIAWNQPGARNLATLHARAEWGLYFDIDQKFRAEPIGVLVSLLGRLDPKVMYHLKAAGVTDPYEQTVDDYHLNTFLVNLPRFRIDGLYDEDFAGHYGHDDVFMLFHWESRGGVRSLLSDTVCFDDLGFRTTTLNRDTARNAALWERRRQNPRRSAGMLRFDWHEIQVPLIPRSC